MDYTLLPSLEHIALTRTAITLWDHNDIRALMARLRFRSLIVDERQKEWQVVEDKVIEEASELPLPKPLKTKVSHFIKVIGVEMLKWRKYHYQNYLGIDLPDELCWTQQGTVDKKKTADALIKDESVDITKRYKLACIYCFENDISALWSKMPESRRKSFYSEEDPIMVKQQELVVLWTYDINGEVAKLDNMIRKTWQRRCSPYQFAFEYAALGGNKVATEYFLQKLTYSEREESLVKHTGYVAKKRSTSGDNATDLPKEYYTDVLCFLLSQMVEEQQMEVFKSYPHQVLECLLDWPWQSFFIETANCVWNFFSKGNYDLLLRMIIDKEIDSCKDCNYQQLFGEFWQQSPNAYKKYIISERVSIGFLLSDLLKIEDEENIRLIFKHATIKEKEDIIFYVKGKNICESMIYEGKWDLLKFFVQECVSSKEVMVKFKEEFKEYMIIRHLERTRGKDRWNKFFQLLDNLFHEDDKKRSIEENDSGLAERLHSAEFQEAAYNKKK